MVAFLATCGQWWVEEYVRVMPVSLCHLHEESPLMVTSQMTETKVEVNRQALPTLPFRGWLLRSRHGPSVAALDTGDSLYASLLVLSFAFR